MWHFLDQQRPWKIFSNNTSLVCLERARTTRERFSDFFTFVLCSSNSISMRNFSRRGKNRIISEIIPFPSNFVVQLTPQCFYLDFLKKIFFLSFFLRGKRGEWNVGKSFVTVWYFWEEKTFINFSIHLIIQIWFW